MNSAISTFDLTKRYGEVVVVNNVNLEIPQGALCGFLGPNGAGKTTIVRMTLRLIWPTAGQIYIMGRDVTSEKTALARLVGAMIEGPTFPKHLSGEEALKLFGLYSEIGNKPLSIQIPRLLKLVALEEKKAKKIGTYSLGQRQRLGIASALLLNPPVVILDEPTNGLDPEGIRDMHVLLRASVLKATPFWSPAIPCTRSLSSVPILLFCIKGDYCVRESCLTF